MRSVKGCTADGNRLSVKRWFEIWSGVRLTHARWCSLPSSQYTAVQCHHVHCSLAPACNGYSPPCYASPLPLDTTPFTGRLPYCLRWSTLRKFNQSINHLLALFPRSHSFSLPLSLRLEWYNVSYNCTSPHLVRQWNKCVKLLSLSCDKVR